ncbi:MAG TPA: zinc ribbon domain-containing protein [Candidatus Olsenella pullicola]|nr:zinc ribbon domain-containing protein [Candidatus Olsenella pullicola]
MFCKRCGSENRDGARFCSACGAPMDEELAGEKSPAPEKVPRWALPVIIVSALVIAAVGVGFALRAAVPAPVEVPEGGAVQEPVTEDVAEGEPKSEEASREETEPEPEGEAEPEAPATEETEPEAPAAPAHDFECEYFYVDVPDNWVRDGTNPTEEAPSWTVEGPLGFGSGVMGYHFSYDGGYNYAGDYVLAGGADVLIDGFRGTTYVGTTSDGHEVWLNEVSSGFFWRDGYFEGGFYYYYPDGATDPDYAVITLK